jgi:hypothetical protein
MCDISLRPLAGLLAAVFLMLQLLWYFSRAATELRFQFLAEQPIGGPSHAILLTDIPGVPSGTFVDKLSWVSRTRTPRCSHVAGHAAA